MHFEYLLDKPEYIPQIAEWYFNQWGKNNPLITLEEETKKIDKFLNKDKFPLILIAIIEEEIVGVAQLKLYEMSIYPNKEHWLGGVYVSKKHRGKGISTQLIEELIKIAKNLGVTNLYLQTENLSGGLYAKLGGYL